MVLLGFIDEPRGGRTGDDDDPSNWTVSRIGGRPAFPSETVAAQLTPSLLCAQCKKEQTFVAQLYCPLSGHKYDRALYLFACRNPSCWNASASWTAVRCQQYDETVPEAAPQEPEAIETVPLSSTDWCDEADAWNSDDDENPPAKKPSSVPSTTKKKEVKPEPEVMLNSMKIDDENEKSSSDDDDDDMEGSSTTKKKSNENNVSVASADAFSEWKKKNLGKKEADSSPNASFPFCYIDIDDEEAIVSEAKVKEAKKLKKSIKNLPGVDEDDDDESMKGGKEKYEKTPDIEHGDVVFYRFQQKIRYAPDQIIRYDWSGNPLILKKIDGHTLSTVQKCRYCQSPCNFEFQLMPALVNFLRIDNQISLEFGTVFVYTCSANCWDESKDLYRFENVFVQADPDQSLFD